MLTIKKQGRQALGVIVAGCLVLTGCGPAGPRALHKGDSLVQSGRFTEAVATLDEATKLLTNQPAAVQAQAWNFLGLAYHGLHDVAKARQCYDQALVLDRNLAAADYNKGCLEFEQTNLPAARDAFTTYTALRGRDAMGFLKLGAVYMHLALQPKTASAEKARLLDSASRAYDAAQKVKATPEARNNLGLIQLYAQNPPSALAISNALSKFTNALRLDPQYAPALLNIAIVYDQYRKDTATAIHAYGLYLTLDKTPPLQWQVRQVVQGLDTARRFSIQTEGGTVETPMTTVTAPGPTRSGMTIIKADQPKTAPPTAPARMTPPILQEATPAEPAATHSVESSPPTRTESPTPTETAHPPTNRPLTSTEVRQPSTLSKINPLTWFGSKPKPAQDGTPVTNPGGGSEAAAAPVQRVTPPPPPVIHYVPPQVSIAPGNRTDADRMMQAGTKAENESRLKDAIANYQGAVKLDPSDFEACVALGMIALKAEEYSTALEALNHAVLLKPDSADARYGFAYALQKKGYFQDAADESEKLLAQHPSETRAHLLVGNLYAQQLGQPDLAREHYKKVLDTDPHNAQATAIRFWLQANP